MDHSDFLVLVFHHETALVDISMFRDNREDTRPTWEI